MAGPEGDKGHITKGLGDCDGSTDFIIIVVGRRVNFKDDMTWLTF